MTCPRCGRPLDPMTLPDDHPPWVCMDCLTAQVIEARDD